MSIRLFIPADEVELYYYANRDMLIDSAHIIACTCNEKRTYLYLTDDGGDMLVSLETSNKCMKRWLNPTVKELKDAIALLQRIAKESGEELEKTVTHA